MTRAARFFLLLGALLGCSTEDGGPRSTTVGATIESGSSVPVSVCVRLPVLLGSQTERSAQVGDAFEVRVHALRHSADISFPGARNESAVSRMVSLNQLLNGYTESVIVTGGDGVDYSVRLRSGCTEVLPADP